MIPKLLSIVFLQSKDLPPISTYFPPPRFPDELMDFGASPRQRIGVLTTRVLRHRGKFANERHVACFDRLRLHASKLYERCSAPALREVIHLLLDDMCLDGLIEAFDSYLNWNINRVAPGQLPKLNGVSCKVNPVLWTTLQK
jgi:hypothetical protein